MTGSANMPCIAALPFLISIHPNTSIMITFCAAEISACYRTPLLVVLILLFAGRSMPLAAANPTAAIAMDSFPAGKMPCYRQFEKEMIQTAHSVATNAPDIQSGVVNYVARVAQLSRRFYICLDKQYTHDKN